MQTAIYVRISQDQTGEGLGVERQRQDCVALAETLGWVVEDIYSDNDRSAASGKPRPDYNRMLDDIRSGRVRAIITWAPDRLYRRLRDLEELCDLIDEYEVKVRAVQAGHVDLSTPAGQMVAGMLGVIAKHEGKQKAERQKRSVRQHRELGMPPGSRTRMFGWTRQGEVIDAEAETVRWLADEVLAGTTITRLCHVLNERGIKTAAGGQWKPTALRKLLRNARLAGHSTLRGEIVGVSQWPAILDPQKWQTVSALLVSRSRTRGPRVSLLPGLIFCGICGTALVTAGRRRYREHRSGAGEWYRTYRCPPDPGLNGCAGVSGDAEPVEAIVEAYVKEWLALPEFRRRLAEARAGGQTHLLAEIDAQERRLVEIQEHVAAGGRHVKMLLRAADTVTDRIDELTHKLAESAPVGIPDDVEAEWPDDLGAQRRLVDLVVARVWLDPVKVRGARFDPTRVRIEPVG